MVIKHKNTTSNKFWLYCVDKKVCIFMLQCAVQHVQYLYSKGEAILIVQKRNSSTGFTLLGNSLCSKLILEVVFESEFSKDITSVQNIGNLLSNLVVCTTKIMLEPVCCKKRQKIDPGQLLALEIRAL